MASQIVENQSLRENLLVITEENQDLQNQVFDLSSKIKESESVNEREIGDFIESFESLKRTYQETSNSLSSKIQHYEATIHNILEEMEKVKKRAEESDRRRSELEEHYNAEKGKMRKNFYFRLFVIELDYLYRK